MSDKKIILSDRIKELSRTTGTGPLLLDGAVRGFSAFGDFYSYGDAVFYAATDGTDYEVGSGQYLQNGLNNILTRFPFRSSDITAGPYYVNATSDAGATAGTAGYFYPLYINESSASGASDGSGAHEHTFAEIPGTIFYMPSNHMGHAGDFAAASTSGNNYYGGAGVASGASISFNEGIKEVYVTYPGKYSVYTAYGLDGFEEPRYGGVAFWGSEQALNYDSNVVWSGGNLGIFQTNPQHAIDVGGPKGYSQIRASGFLDGGSGILFSGVAGSYSGGRQLEPFLRNKVNNETGTDAVIALSGLVDESLLFIKQPEGFIFAGPPSGSCGVGCADNYPTFRYLYPNDLPVLPYIAQYNDANPNVDGAIALYKESGVVKYDNEFVFKDGTNRLGVNVASPNATLDVFGDVKISGAITSYLVTTSGRIDHLLFGETESQTWNVAIGDVNTGGSSTKSIYVGSNAGYSSAATVTQQVGIGLRAGANTTSNTRCFFVGDEAGWTSTSCTQLVGIGKEAGWQANGCNYTTFIGGNAGYHASGLDQSLGIGSEAWAGATFCDYSQAVGYRAGYQAWELNYSEAIGYQAGLQASGDRNIFVGDNAGYKASGDYNIFIGKGAGYKLSVDGQAGSNNIEIVTNGSTVTQTVMAGLSNKININDVVHGDSNTKRLVVGNVALTDYTPNATLEVKPQNATDVVSIFQGTTSQSADLAQWRNVASVPLVKIEAADGAIVTSGTIYAYGSIETSGTVSASGGIEFRDRVPSNTALKLYNDGGTLKWGSASLDTGGNNTFNFTDGTVSPLTITDGQTVIISGVSGVGVHFDTSARQFNINPSGLSGVCFSQIGTISGFLDNRINGLPGGYGHWLASDGTLAGDTITSAETVFISGVSGVNTHWNSSLNRLEINPSGLSGVLQEQIDSLNAGAATVTAGSGLTMVGTEMNMNINSSGQLEHLIFNDNQIRIGEGAGDSFDVGDIGLNWTAIGYQAGYGASGNDYTNIMGYQAGSWSSGNDYSNIIGYQAGLSGSGSHSVNIVGRQAGYEASGITYTNIVGTYAGYRATGCTHSNIIGINAGFQANNSVDTNMFGSNAGYQATGCNNSNMIGNFVGYKANGHNYINYIGRSAGYKATGCYNVNAVGRQAGSYLLNTDGANIIGYDAGAYASGNNFSNMIGTDAGYESSGCDSSNMMGSGAGYKSWDVSYSNMIGLLAGSGANNSNYVNLLGDRAGSSLTNSMWIEAIGTLAGANASGLAHSSALGNMAAYYATGCTGSNFVGASAGIRASGANYVNCIGWSAGYEVSGVSIVDMIGYQAGYESYDCDRSIMIGDKAGYRSHKSWDSIMIGGSAGHGTTSDNSIFLGYYAGKERSGSYSLIIKTNTSTSDGGASWSDTDENYVFDIAGMFNGVSSDAGSTPTGRQLRIGTPPDSVADLSNICTSIKPQSAADVVLKVIPAASQTASLLQSARLTDGAANEIINKDGYLTIPVADIQAGTDLYTNSFTEANKISKTEGAVCVASLAGTEHLCVCIGTSWYKTADLTAL